MDKTDYNNGVLYINETYEKLIHQHLLNHTLSFDSFVAPPGEYGEYSKYKYYYEFEIDELYPPQNIYLTYTLQDNNKGGIYDYNITTNTIKGFVQTIKPLYSVNLHIGGLTNETTNIYYGGVDETILYDGTIPNIINQKNVLLTKNGNDLIISNIDGIHYNQEISLIGNKTMETLNIIPPSTYNGMIKIINGYSQFKNNNTDTMIGLVIKSYANEEEFIAYSGGRNYINI